MLGLLFSDPRTFVLVIFALIVSITIHEFAHAFVADKLGDPTARALGRVTLDPRAHLDPLGTILLIVAGFGWGRPVPFDPSYLKNPKKDSALIALAGPVSNFLLAILLTFLFKTFYNILPVWVFGFVSLAVLYNLVLGIFNLIPIYPLDGYRIVAGFLKGKLYLQWVDLSRYGIYILLALILTGGTQFILGPLLGIATKMLGLNIF